MAHRPNGLNKRTISPYYDDESLLPDFQLAATLIFFACKLLLLAKNFYLSFFLIQLKIVLHGRDAITPSPWLKRRIFKIFQIK